MIINISQTDNGYFYFRIDIEKVESWTVKERQSNFGKKEYAYQFCMISGEKLCLVVSENQYQEIELLLRAYMYEKNKNYDLRQAENKDDNYNSNTKN